MKKNKISLSKLFKITNNEESLANEQGSFSNYLVSVANDQGSVANYQKSVANNQECRQSSTPH